MTVPAIPTDLAPATADETKSALRALFTAFPSHDSGNAAWRVAGYQDALFGEPLWAVERAVRRFLRGEVCSHDGRFLPTSAELARVVREESAAARRMAERQDRPVMIADHRDPEVTAAEREKRAERLRDLARMIGGGSETRDDKLAELEIVEADKSNLPALMAALDRTAEYRRDDDGPR